MIMSCNGRGGGTGGGPMTCSTDKGEFWRGTRSIMKIRWGQVVGIC